MVVVARSTHSEHWHRVRDLRPRLRAGVVVRGTWYRGERWHVVGDPVSGRFHRLSGGAYALAGRLDGRRTIHEAWELAAQAAGDDAPTQGEAIAILGQMWASGVVALEATPDVRALLERASKGRRREVASGAMSVLFPRVPLVDPDRFLAWVTPWAGWVFSLPGFIAWALLVGVGIASVVGSWDRIGARADRMLEPTSAVWALAAYVVAKLLHEIGHGVACKALAKREGVAARVPTMGVMILVGVPSPYVDASAAWGLRSRWHRAAVGAAGMYVEVALAAVAAIVWSRVGPGPVSDWAFATMVVAGVTTVVFNANPLLRYDGYYILSDLAEMPNLARRSTDQLWHLASKYVWGVRGSLSPARDGVEAWMLTGYAVAAAVYRFALAWAITIFVWNRVPVVGTLVGVVAMTTLVVVPVGMAVKRILSGADLASVRGRAVGTTAIAVMACVVGAGLIPMPRTVMAMGVVEADGRADVFAASPGLVDAIADTGTEVAGGTSVVARITNAEAIADLRAWEAAALRVELERQRALLRDVNEARAWESRAETTAARITEAQRVEDGLTVVAPIDGEWLAAPGVRAIGSPVAQGEPLGAVSSQRGSRVVVDLRDAQAAAVVAAMGDRSLATRVRGAAGNGGVVRGDLVAVSEAPEGDRGFEATVDLGDVSLRPGARVIARIELPRAPLLPRWIDAVRRTVVERDVAERSR